MSKLKELSKITTRYTNKEGVANPATQKYDYKRPTLVSLSTDDMKQLFNSGTLEVRGITIIYEK